MARLLALSLALAILALAVARYATSAAWIYGVIISGGLFGTSAGLAIGLAARRLRPIRWHGAAALVVALAAAGTRFALVAHIDRAGSPTGLLPVLLACASVSWGALGLLWGTAGVTDSVRPLAPAQLLVSTAAVSIALYSVAPLGWLLGLTFNRWTLIGLFGLSAIAWGITAGSRALLRRARGGPG